MIMTVREFNRGLENGRHLVGLYQIPTVSKVERSRMILAVRTAMISYLNQDYYNINILHFLVNFDPIRANFVFLLPAITK